MSSLPVKSQVYITSEFSEASVIKRQEAFNLLNDEHDYATTDAKNHLNTITNILNYETDWAPFKIKTNVAHSYSENKSPDGLAFNFFQTGVGLNEADPGINPNKIQDYVNDAQH